MSRSRIACLLASIAAAACVAADVQIRHVRPADEDDWIACVSNLLGRRVTRHYAMAWGRALPQQVACSTSVEAFRSDLHRADAAVFDAGEWAVVLPRRLSAADPPWRWTRLEVRTHIDHRPSPHGLPLSLEEANRIGRRALDVARPTPVNPGFSPTNGDTLTLHLQVDVDRVRLSPRHEAVIVVTAMGPAARLVYGEMRDEAYLPLWDSPLLDVRELSWEYVDVDGDGIDEIAFWGTRSPRYQTLVALDRSGIELTRQADCPTIVFDSHLGTCPIVADSIAIDHDVGASGARDIVATTAEGDVRYRLRQGTYTAEQQ